MLEPFERVRAGAAPVVRVPPERRGVLELLFGELRDATECGASLAVQKSLLTLVLHEVRRAAGWELGGVEPGGVVVAALRFIERNCLGPLSLRAVAEAVGRSPSHVATALSRATGRTAGAWILAGRLAQARRLLLHSELGVDRVAERVGYADVTHFIRMFRREHGVTPAAWRAAQRRPRGEH